LKIERSKIENLKSKV